MNRKVVFLHACLLITSCILLSTTDQPRPRPEFTRQLESLRHIIIASAHRHNDQKRTRFSDYDFAVIMTLILYNENLGAVDERITLLRFVSPLYQSLQQQANRLMGTDLTVWPSNIRPSVALEILNHQLPINPPGTMEYIPVHVFGTTINTWLYRSERDLYRAINEEIIQPKLAIEYLAANLERGIYRAEREKVPITWQALLAWHIRGIVSRHDIANNLDALRYTQRTTYLKDACRLIYRNAPPRDSKICIP